MQVFLIPLVNVPQEFSISLANKNLILVTKYLDLGTEDDSYWALDILNEEDNSPIIAGIPLIVGKDLLAQYEYLGLQGELWVVSEGDVGKNPTLENLGIDSQLYFKTDVETN